MWILTNESVPVELVVMLLWLVICHYFYEYAAGLFQRMTFLSWIVKLYSVNRSVLFIWYLMTEMIKARRSTGRLVTTKHVVVSAR